MVWVFSLGFELNTSSSINGVPVETVSPGTTVTATEVFLLSVKLEGT